MQAQRETVAGAEPGRLEWLAGYRVLRRLGSGSRASVYLGHAEDSELGVAIKVFEPSVTTESLDAEIDALSAVSSPHVVRMLDIATAPGRPSCIVLQRLAGGSLAALLARSPTLTPGTAVTVLVSVARGLDALRAAGFDHGRLSPTTVLFDENGCPVITGLGHAAPTVNNGPSALARLVRTVFDHVDDEAAAAGAEQFARWLEETTPGPPVLAAIEDRLFELAEPQPVLQVAKSAADWLEGLGATHDPVPSRTAVAPPRPSGVRTARRARAHVAHPQAAPWWARGSELKEAFRQRVRQRKRPLIVAGVVGGALLVLALTVLPVDGRSAGSTAPRLTPLTSSPLANSAPAAAVPGPRPPKASTASTASPAEMAETAAVTGEEPVAATVALLALRATCLRARSPACLAAADEDGSPMLDADRSLIASDRAGESHARQTYDGYEASLLQRSGGSALIALSPPGAGSAGGPGTPKPASALVIEEETGWRLREVFPD